MAQSIDEIMRDIELEWTRIRHLPSKFPVQARPPGRIQLVPKQKRHLTWKTPFRWIKRRLKLLGLI